MYQHLQTRLMKASAALPYSIIMGRWQLLMDIVKDQHSQALPVQFSAAIILPTSYFGCC